MNKIAKTLTIVLFFGIMLAMPIITLLAPKEEFSDVENRNLAILPKFSLENVKDRSYMKGLETYLSDHFIGRSDWIGLKTDLEIATGKKEINDVFVLNEKLIEKFSNINYIEVDKSIEAINNFASKTDKEIFFMLAPTAAGIYSDELPANSPSNDQKAFIDEVYSKLNKDTVTTLDVFDSLSSTQSEYIYYRTDHHWTTLGAYYAYATAINQLGSKPLSLNSYEIEHASNEFLGTLYSKVIFENIPKDTIDFFHFKNGFKVKSVTVQTGREVNEYKDMYFRDYLTKKDKYSSFLGNNQPIVTVKTDMKEDKKILIIKDSYAHCFVPFLTQHYSEITMIDMRYINTDINNLIELEDYEQILFLYNASSFSKDENKKKLNFTK